MPCESGAFFMGFAQSEGEKEARNTEQGTRKEE